MNRRLAPLCFLIFFVLNAMAGGAQARRMVIIDQDGSGPGGTNQMAMMLLLQSPQAEVMGITMVTGDAWEPEEVQHTLRMLELIHRTDVPVVPGAVFPLVRSEQEWKIERQLYGGYAWYGAWGDASEKTGRVPHHGPYVVPKMVEGEPMLKPAGEDAAHFLIRQVSPLPRPGATSLGWPL